MAAPVGRCRLVAELRRHDDALPPSAQSTSEIFLAQSVAIELGRIEEIDARLQRGVHDRGGCVGIETPTEVVASQADDRDLERADASVLHLDSPLGVAPLMGMLRSRNVSEITTIGSRLTDRRSVRFLLQPLSL